MISKSSIKKARKKTLKIIKKAGIVVTKKEAENIEIADFGLNDLSLFGLEIIVYINTSRCCAKEIVMFKNQTCPEHRHPAINGNPGKEETFRVRYGSVYLYVPGSNTKNPSAKLPKNKISNFTVWHEIKLNPGEQYTLKPDTLHWFQAGKKGAIVSEFSTNSVDEADIFTDKAVKRV
jgi:D-lyxose ketol-isomerase